MNGVTTKAKEFLGRVCGKQCLKTSTNQLAAFGHFVHLILIAPMSLLAASLDDLVFEGRNRTYGAYQLRQEYQQRLTTAGGLTLGLCLLLLLGWATWPTAQEKADTKTTGILTPMEVEIKPPLDIEKPKQAALASAPAPQPARAHSSVATPTKVAPDKLVPPVPTESLLPPSVEDGPVGPATAGEANNLGDGNSNEATNASPAEATPANTEFTYVEKMPEFAGGQAALLRYLRDHLRYPSNALRESIEGRVFLSFVVRADGTIADVSVLKGIGYGLDEEAQRVVRQMPAWTPGYQSKHAVAVRFTLPITFKIQ